MKEKDFIFKDCIKGAKKIQMELCVLLLDCLDIQKFNFKNKRGIDSMKLKYNLIIKDNIIAQRFQVFVNQIYKLLPMRE
jgi:hypothetical protein